MQDPRIAAINLIDISIKHGMQRIAEAVTPRITSWLCAYYLRRKNDTNLPRFVSIASEKLPDGSITYRLVPHEHNDEPCESCVDVNAPLIAPNEILEYAAAWHDEVLKEPGGPILPENAVLYVRYLPVIGAHYIGWGELPVDE